MGKSKRAARGVPGPGKGAIGMDLKNKNLKNDHTEQDRQKKRNAWKKYGAVMMAGVLLTGTAATAGFSLDNSQVQAEENQTEETQTEISLNLASDQDEETSEEDSEAETEETTEEAAEEETETEETETPETYEAIQNAESVEGAIVTTDVSAVVEEFMPCIVSITNYSVQELETFYYGTQEFESVGSASGIIVAQNDQELLIATNSHVVDGSEELNVCFTADAEDPEDLIVPGKVKGSDTSHELAVVAVQLGDIPEEVRSQLKIATLGSSDELKVGEAAIAVGNALGYGQSVTCGIISALNREVSLDDFSSEVILTDAAINYGNSGGALLNSKGEVIGINVAKEVGDDAENMGYSIPIDTAIPILEEMINRETRDKVEDGHGYMGVTVVDVSEEGKELYDMPAGAFVYEVTEGSAAEEAGIQKGDVITAFDGVSVSSSDALVELLEYYEAGETVTVEVQTANNGAYEAREVEVTLQEGSSDVYEEDTSSDETEDSGEEIVPDGEFDEIPYFGYGNDNGLF